MMYSKPLDARATKTGGTKRTAKRVETNRHKKAQSRYVVIGLFGGTLISLIECFTANLLISDAK